MSNNTNTNANAGTSNVAPIAASTPSIALSPRATSPVNVTPAMQPVAPIARTSVAALNFLTKIPLKVSAEGIPTANTAKSPTSTPNPSLAIKSLSNQSTTNTPAAGPPVSPRKPSTLNLPSLFNKTASPEHPQPPSAFAKPSEEKVIKLNISLSKELLQDIAASARNEIIFSKGRESMRIENIKNTRIYLRCQPQGCPIVVFSIQPFKRQHAKKKDAAPKEQSAVKDKLGISYSGLLDDHTNTDEYDPYYLDDPKLLTGKHRVVMNLPSYRHSIIPFVTKKELKNELNVQFKEKHREVKGDMTLSKIRKLKSILLDIALSKGVEISSVALSYVLLEKLVLKNYVKKDNRRVVAAVCLLLAIKFDEIISRVFVRQVVDVMEKELDISAKEVFSQELDIYRELSFCLFTSLKEIMPHYNRLQEMLDLKFSSDASKKQLYSFLDDPNHQQAITDLHQSISSPIGNQSPKPFLLC
eukprot:TRINITY_DN8803_c0_g1_i2.p1 TRINITY_DN8803_c0_g1~~TRINITY_DN8803_c0_g1_i2.p1  ORF type:complete len:471 (-),score=106.44 TRINITY_DN8803_c0_g1_i2:38-1450(-)